MNVWGKLGLFSGGVLFGTAGIKVLISKDAKKLYTHTTAAALRAKECIMTTVTKVKENADDILVDANTINEQRAENESAEEIFDTSTEQTQIKKTTSQVKKPASQTKKTTGQAKKPAGQTKKAVNAK